MWVFKKVLADIQSKECIRYLSQSILPREKERKKEKEQARKKERRKKKERRRKGGRKKGGYKKDKITQRGN